MGRYFCQSNITGIHCRTMSGGVERCNSIKTNRSPHLDKNNELQKHKARKDKLSNSMAEKGLDVNIDHRLNRSKQCYAAVKKANLTAIYSQCYCLQNI